MTTSDTRPFAWGVSSFRFDGHVVVVTGASRGIGAEVAAAFAAAGARLVIHGRDASALEEQRRRLSAAGSDVVCVQGDVRRPETAEALVEVALDSYGGIDILVNNAGGNFASPLSELSGNGWRALVETNLSSVFLCAAACYPVFRERGGGSVLNIGSVAGQQAHPHRAAYGAAKAAVSSLTKTMAWEWAPDVRVNCVAPGAIATEASRFADAGTAASAARYIPLGRVGATSDVANACLFLASDAAAFITGQTLNVDGGPLIALPADVDLLRQPSRTE